MVCFIAKKALNFIHRCKTLSFLLVVLISGRKSKPFMLSTKLIILLTTSLHLYHMSTVLIFVMTSKNFRLDVEKFSSLETNDQLIRFSNDTHFTIEHTTPYITNIILRNLIFETVFRHFFKGNLFLELDRLRYRHI